MEYMIDIERAAHIAGVSDAEIKQHISDGHLDAPDGKFQVSELLGLYPDINIKCFDMVDIVAQIKDDTIIKALQMKSGTVDLDDLIDQLTKTCREATFYRGEVNRYKHLLQDVVGELDDIRDKTECKGRITALIKWLEGKIKEH